MVGTTRGKDIIFDTLAPAKKAAIRETMAKEWSRWQQLKATILVSADMLQELPADLQIVGTRWVLTEKANGTAKARFIVHGCQEKTNDIRSDSPTSSRDRLMLTLIHAAQRGWSVSQCDADCSYLQSEGINRTLVPRMPRRHPPPGQEPGALAIATGAIYGTKDAGRHWYMHLRKHLQQAGFFEPRLERSTYVFHVDGKLVCMVHTHVDDLLIARQADCPVHDTIIAKLTKDLHLRKPEGDVLTYLGRRIELKKDEIRITQVEAAETLEPIVLTAARRCLPDSPLTAEELSDYRSLGGSIQWLTQQTRPDFTVHASKGAQCMAKATIRDALTLNRYAADIKSTKDRGLVFRRNIVDLSFGTATIVAYGDASFASSEGEKSQHGEIIMITHDPAKLLSGHFEMGHLISYKSGTIKRVVRSTLASEAYSISEAAEQAEWIRHILHELHSGPSVSLREVQATACPQPVIVCTDSRNLADTVQSNAGTTSDKRLRIVTAMLRQTFAPDTGMTLRWVNTHEMYADALAKVMVALAVIAIMSSKHYSPPAGRIGRVASLAQRASSGTARVIALATLATSPTGAHAARLQLDFGERVIFCQLALRWRGLA